MGVLIIILTGMLFILFLLIANWGNESQQNRNQSWAAGKAQRAQVNPWCAVWKVGRRSDSTLPACLWLPGSCHPLSKGEISRFHLPRAARAMTCLSPPAPAVRSLFVSFKCQVWLLCCHLAVEIAIWDHCKSHVSQGMESERESFILYQLTAEAPGKEAARFVTHSVMKTLRCASHRQLSRQSCCGNWLAANLIWHREAAALILSMTLLTSWVLVGGPGQSTQHQSLCIPCSSRVGLKYFWPSPHTARFAEVRQPGYHVQKTAFLFHLFSKDMHWIWPKLKQNQANLRGSRLWLS